MRREKRRQPSRLSPCVRGEVSLEDAPLEPRVDANLPREGDLDPGELVEVFPAQTARVVEQTVAREVAVERSSAPILHEAGPQRGQVDVGGAHSRDRRLAKPPQKEELPRNDHEDGGEDHDDRHGRRASRSGPAPHEKDAGGQRDDPEDPDGLDEHRQAAHRSAADRKPHRAAQCAGIRPRKANGLAPGKRDQKAEQELGKQGTAVSKKTGSHGAEDRGERCNRQRDGYGSKNTEENRSDRSEEKHLRPDDERRPTLLSDRDRRPQKEGIGGRAVTGGVGRKVPGDVEIILRVYPRDGPQRRVRPEGHRPDRGDAQGPRKRVAGPETAARPAGRAPRGLRGAAHRSPRAPGSARLGNALVRPNPPPCATSPAPLPETSGSPSSCRRPRTGCGPRCGRTCAGWQPRTAGGADRRSRRCWR